MKSFDEAVSGLSPEPAAEFRINSLTRADFIRPHNDSVGSNRLAFVLYLSPDWTPPFGGVLEIVAGKWKHRANAGRLQ